MSTNKSKQIIMTNLSWYNPPITQVNASVVNLLVIIIEA